MISAEDFCKTLIKAGFGPFTGVPCSFLAPVLNFIYEQPYIEYYLSSSEGEAVGIAAGWALSGKIPVVMMQNSGLGNAVNPLTSLMLIYELPVLMLVTLRGEPGQDDAPQHKLMGNITASLLKTMDVYFEFLAADLTGFMQQIDRLYEIIKHRSKPVVLIIRKGAVAKYPRPKCKENELIVISRKEAIKTVIGCLVGDEAVVSTTGKVSRELYCYSGDKQNNFYVVGSMGCAAAIGFGLAVSKPHKKVVVLDGDGALLMKLGVLATIGKYRPANFIHIVFDNEAYDSTGGQETASGAIALERVAKAAEYASTEKVTQKWEIEQVLNQALYLPGPHFLLIKVRR
jgi:phosphonopyruvate decarboxylase